MSKRKVGFEGDEEDGTRGEFEDKRARLWEGPNEEDEEVVEARQKAKRGKKQQQQKKKQQPQEEANEEDEEILDSEKRRKQRQDERAHTLDSDEEDAEDTVKSYKHTDEDMHEKIDEEFKDGGYAITGFNLDEEEEEGHFDEEGNFIFDKDDDHAGDEWLEGTKVYDPSEAQKYKEKKGKKMDEEEDVKLRDRFQLIKDLLAIMKPHETVTQALRRLGGKKPAKGGRKADEDGNGALSAEDAAKAKAAFAAVTTCADELLALGQHSVYQDTYEKLALEVEKQGQVMFEFKWSEEEGADIHGPFTAQQMAQWQDQDYFAKGVWYREVGKGTDAPFYSSKRVDFSLFVDDD